MTWTNVKRESIQSETLYSKVLVSLSFLMFQVRLLPLNDRPSFNDEYFSFMRRTLLSYKREKGRKEVIIFNQWRTQPLIRCRIGLKLFCTTDGRSSRMVDKLRRFGRLATWVRTTSTTRPTNTSYIILCFSLTLQEISVISVYF